MDAVSKSTLATARWATRYSDQDHSLTPNCCLIGGTFAVANASSCGFGAAADCHFVWRQSPVGKEEKLRAMANQIHWEDIGARK